MKVYFFDKLNFIIFVGGRADLNVDKDINHFPGFTKKILAEGKFIFLKHFMNNEILFLKKRDKLKIEGHVLVKHIFWKSKP